MKLARPAAGFGKLVTGELIEGNDSLTAGQGTGIAALVLCEGRTASSCGIPLCSSEIDRIRIQLKITGFGSFVILDLLEG